MKTFDVFNGDADGLCAWLQWRLAQPQATQLISGVKRDIDLLKQVDVAQAAAVNVFDIALDKNRSALLDLLQHRVPVCYVDHHYAGEIPQSAYLQCLIDTCADVCSALLVDRYLGGRYRYWALTGAFGDNLDGAAYRLAAETDLTEREIQQIRQLGVCLNYNSYGESLDDLLISPLQLAEYLLNFDSPLQFVAEYASLVEQLQLGYRQDIAHADRLQPDQQNQQVAVYILPDCAWARRVGGVFGNRLANAFPQRAHAVLSPNTRGHYQVSVRAPLHNKRGADVVCRQFVGGGGREAAAGINDLAVSDYAHFVQLLMEQYTD
jgi:hypothetical protein